MNVADRTAGLKRLAVAILGLIGASLVLALVFAGLGSPAPYALSRGLGLVGIVLVIAGVVSFGRTGPVRRVAGVYQRANEDDRKDAERQAAGLLALGIVFSTIALAIV